MTSRIAITLLAYGLALWPQIHWFFARTRDPSDEPLGILALVTAALFAWSRRHQFTPYSTLGWIALMVTVGASFILPPLLTAALALVTIALATGLFRSPGLLGLLLLSLPLVASLNFYLAWPFRLGIAACSEKILNLCSLSVTRAGTLLLYQGYEVGVDAPCSGIRMLWFTGYLTCALATLHHLPWKKFLLLVPFALLLSFLANLLRATLLFFPEAQLISLPHSAHDLAGLLLHLATALLLSNIIKRTNQTTKCSINHPSSCSALA